MLPLRLLCSLALPLTSLAASTRIVSSDTRRTNTGPLTEIFTPPPSCTEIRTVNNRYPDLQMGCEGPGGNECCPPKWASNRYFSPGVCPSGYQACTLPTTRQRLETTNLCCPASFDCPTDIFYGECRSYINTPIPTNYTISGTVYSSAMSIVYATPIQIRFQATDSGVVPIPTASFNLPGPRAGLSAAAKAGIGAGVSVGAILILTAVVFFIKRNGRRTGGQPGGGEDVPLQTGTEPVAVAADAGDRPPPYSKS
ncbi:unnamed protein product [Parascedosporium putredinis]|uniref:Uncharacterized protein n=1 Tax=Parascedosporium putredinis TaxID=1442378 RepID=A0A9P1M590_9PEZI|nr:unnamed protein product [Parascedosporium putredinis]CAI7987849.1 unnamed protein product [Parascedosporium putredinis]